jgi:hypothetical protein
MYISPVCFELNKQYLKEAIIMSYREEYAAVLADIHNGIVITDRKLLMLQKSSDRKHIAHSAAEHGMVIEDKEILKLVDKRGWSVAHSCATQGQIFDDMDILLLQTKRGITVAHVMASKGCIFTDTDILTLRDKTGHTVAHEMARRGHKLTGLNILTLSDNTGWTVAHQMALSKNAYTFTDIEILKLTNKFGYTVAHLMAHRGHVFTDPDILSWKTGEGWDMDKVRKMGTGVRGSWGIAPTVRGQGKKNITESVEC